MTRRASGGVLRLVLALAVGFVAAACTSDDEGTPFTLHTHCGIDEVHYNGQWYERVGGRLHDGAGNPPPGWDNPEHEGMIVTVDDSTILYTDDAEHREEFRRREGATEPKRMCA